MKNPKISVIIPVYNGENTLKSCLNSVVNQTYKNYEIIVVDNNSKDNTKSIINEFQKKNRKIKYLFESKRGRGAARYKGEINAKGEIILMTDSDCIVPVNWIEEMIKTIENWDVVQGFEEPISDNYWNRYRHITFEEKYKNEKMQDPLGKIDTKNFAIKTSILKKIGNTSRKYFSGNDTYLSIKLTENNFKVRFMKDIKVKHFHPSSLKAVFNKYIYRARWTAIISKDHKNFLKKTDFLKDTCQTPKTFFKFFPGLFFTLIKKGPRYTFYDFIVGISWRIGLLVEWIKK